MRFFEQDPEGYQKLADKVAQAKSDKAAKEERWLELEMKRESLGE